MSGIDEAGALRLRDAAVVLLSGGFDSTACLYWAHSKYRNVRAIGYDYGQPHRDAEVVAAARAARELGIEFEVVALADTMRSGLLDGVTDHAASVSAVVNRAFVPARNLIFLSVALSRACQWFPTSNAIDLVIGACKEDAGGFPDCREQFFDTATKVLSMAVDRKIRACAPYVKMPKANILTDVSLRFQSGVAALQTSWSCYRGGKAPCGTCTACVLRAQAFEAGKVEDLCAAPVMTGGDVERARRLEG
jgi:7-cyano-7-deazaguanine synthase